MKQPNGQVAGHRCDDRLPKADGNVEERRDATKAIIQKEYGPPDVLELGDIERPEIGDGEVLVRVRAAGVDRGVWHLMKGMPYLLRLFGYGLRAPKNPIPGMDVSGIVETVGENVSRFRPGDEVFGVGVGTFAEYASAREDKLAPKPSNLTFEEAAVLAISGLTALQALRDHGRVEPGRKTLIIGASGGVGSFAVQIAKAFGAEVAGVCSAAKVEMVRSIGADHVIDYARKDFTQSGRKYDLIFQLAGTRSPSECRRVLAPKGTLVQISGDSDGRWIGPVDRIIHALVLSPFVGQRMASFTVKPNKEDLRFLKQLIETGKLQPVIDRTYPLSETPEAIRYLESGHARGKVVITVPGRRA